MNMGYLVSSICLIYFRNIKERLRSIYAGSVIRRMISKTSRSLVTAFRFSLFSRMADAGIEGLPNYIEASKIKSAIIDYPRNLMRKLKSYFIGSYMAASLMGIKRDFFMYPLKSGGVIVVVATVINLALSFILKKHIIVLSRILYGLVLFIGVSGLYSALTWDKIKKSSLLMGKIK